MTVARVRGRKTMRLLGVLVVVVFATASCMNPFSSGDSRDAEPTGGTAGTDGAGSKSGTGSLVVTFGGSGFTAQTILPEETLEDVIDTYTVRLDGGPLQGVEFEETGLLPGDFPFTFNEVPTGEWTLTVEGWGSDGSDPPEPVLVGEFIGGVTILDGGTVQVDATVRGTQYGTGRLEYTLTWPAGEADDVTVAVIPGAYDPEESIQITGNEVFEDDGFTVLDFDVVGGQLDLILDPIESGTYFLVITLLREEGQNAPVIEAAQVYDNRTSSKTVTLESGALTQPPAAPTDLIVEFTAENVFNVYWTDNSNTEQGFRMYQHNGSGNRVPLGTQMGPGTEEATNLSSGFTPPVDDFTLEVVAFNQFGESVPLEVAFRLLDSAQLPDFNPNSSLYSNSSDWVALGEPGRLESGTPVIGGADSMELFVSTSDSLNDPLSLGVPVHSGGTLSYDLAGLPGLSGGQSYWWRTQAIIGAARIVYPVRQFTVRDGNLYVAASGNVGAAGSVLGPLASVQEAVNLAEEGETIRIAPGSYDAAVTVAKSVTIRGDDRDLTVLRNSTGATTVTVSAGSVENLTVEVGGAGATRRGILVNGGTVTVSDVRVQELSTIGNVVRGIDVGGGTGHAVLRAEVSLADASASSQTAIRVENTGGVTTVRENRVHMVSQPGGSTNFGLLARSVVDAFNNVIALTGADNGFNHRMIDVETANASGSRILHNAIVNGVPDGNRILMRVATATDVTFSNNIVLGHPAATENPLLFALGGTVSQVHNNLYFAVPNGETWVQNTNANVWATGNVYANPFLGPGPVSGWYEPTDSSPGVLRTGGSFAASNAAGATLDFDGNLRSAGNTSIGPYQYVVALPVIPADFDAIDHQYLASRNDLLWSEGVVEIQSYGANLELVEGSIVAYETRNGLLGAFQVIDIHRDEDAWQDGDGFKFPMTFQFRTYETDGSIAAQGVLIAETSVTGPFVRRLDLENGSTSPLAEDTDLLWDVTDNEPRLLTANGRMRLVSGLAQPPGDAVARFTFVRHDFWSFVWNSAGSGPGLLFGIQPGDGQGDTAIAGFTNLPGDPLVSEVLLRDTLGTAPVVQAVGGDYALFTTQDFAASVSFTTPGTVTQQSLMMKDDGTASSGRQIRLQLTNTGNLIWVINNSSGTLASGLQGDTRYHLVFSVAGDTIRWRWNGGAVQQAAVPNRVLNNGFPLIIGDSAFNDRFTGRLQDVRWFNRPLTDGEMLQIYRLDR